MAGNSGTAGAAGIAFGDDDSFDLGTEIPVISPTSGASGSGSPTGDNEPSAPKRRGRPPGTGRKAGGESTGKEKASASSKVLKPEDIAPYIMMGHMVVANKVPEFAISPDEAQRLAVAICNYVRHSKLVVSQQKADLMMLIGVVLMIEGPRAVAAVQRKKREKAAYEASQSGAVPSFVMPPSPGGGGNDLWKSAA